jgi:hypothetical protein
MDLAQCEIGVMLLDLFRVPPVGYDVEGDHANLDPGSRDDWLIVGIELDVCVRACRHDDSSSRLP